MGIIKNPIPRKLPDQVPNVGTGEKIIYLKNCPSCGAPSNGFNKCEYCGRKYYIQDFLFEAENSERSILYADDEPLLLI